MPFFRAISARSFLVRASNRSRFMRGYSDARPITGQAYRGPRMPSMGAVFDPDIRSGESDAEEYRSRPAGVNRPASACWQAAGEGPPRPSFWGVRQQKKANHTV